jgi:hypothetical protein
LQVEQTQIMTATPAMGLRTALNYIAGVVVFASMGVAGYSLFVIITASGVTSDLMDRVSSMKTDVFDSIPGGCTITATSYASRYSYSWSSPTCSSQCNFLKACSERREHTFTISGNSTSYSAAPQDVLLDASSTCDSDSGWVAETTMVGSNIPCWRARDASSVTRNEAHPENPLSASYDGLAYRANYRAAQQAGYSCGNADCIMLVDPAVELAYFEDYQYPGLPLFAGLAGGFLFLLLVICGWGAYTMRDTPCGCFPEWCPCERCGDDSSSDSEEPVKKQNA